MESALRAQLDKTRIQPINWDKSFGDALQIDLSVMNIHVIKVSAPIKKWRGRRLNEPARATIDLTIRSRGEKRKIVIHCFGCGQIHAKLQHGRR